VGNLGAPNFNTFAGPTNANGVVLLPTPIVNTRQPTDANGNEGAGRVINPNGASGFAGKFWGDAAAVFGQISTPNGATDPPTGNPTLLGLGPAFNGNGCFMCHSQPTIGGTSAGIGGTNPGPNTPPGTGTPGFTQNPQLIVAHLFGATNAENLSPIITTFGPIRETRFILSETDPTRLTLDGGVHDAFTIQGRSDAPPGCALLQPDLTTQLTDRNAIFRIPTPTFGLGLVENVSNADLINNAALEHGLNPTVQNAVLNVSGNDGTVTRFGWKAQNKSLLLFAGEAANVELGMTNELFPNERTPGTNCTGNLLPEDDTRLVTVTGATPGDSASIVSSAIENFATFMRLNGAPGQCDFASGIDGSGDPVCNPLSASALAGQAIFNSIGCNACHTPSFTTQPSNVPGLSNRTFQPFSDFGLHHMGSTLADGVTQGLAGPDQFRTAPLWGLGQRLFFLHDGRTSDLRQAILAHASGSVFTVTPLTSTDAIDSAASSATSSNAAGVTPDAGTAIGTPPSFTPCYVTAAAQVFTVTFPLDGNATAGFAPVSGTLSCGSEANGVIAAFNALSNTQQQNLFDFLRSL
jgi:hypothetical protein